MTEGTGKKAGPDIAAWLRSPVARALAALVLIFIIGFIFNAEGTFFKWDTHRDMLRHISVFAILGCGMTVVIITAVTGYGGDPYGYKKFLSQLKIVPEPDGFFPKPIDRDALLAKVNELLA